jgi:hypothetical protein
MTQLASWVHDLQHQLRRNHSIWYYVNDWATIDLASVNEVVDETDDGHTTEHGNSYKICVSWTKSTRRVKGKQIVPQFIIFASTFAKSGKKLMTVENTS